MDTPQPTATEPSPPSHAERLRRRVLLVVVAAGLTVALYPVDRSISEALRAVRPTGDVRRELELIQQFGSPTTIALGFLLVWRLDPRRLRLVLDWIAAAVTTSAAMWLIKIGTGRPRPRLGDSDAFLGPVRAWAGGSEAAPLRAWRFWADGASDLWSMPSSHTAAATVAAVALSRMYPRLTPVVWTLVAVVAYARVALGAHWPTDVIVGGALAYLIADAVIRREVGQRLWSALFRR